LFLSGPGQSGPGQLGIALHWLANWFGHILFSLMADLDFKGIERSLFRNSTFQCFQQLQWLPWDCQTLENTGKTKGSWVIAVGDSSVKVGVARCLSDLYGVNFEVTDLKPFPI
jgi:hypothetical protein